MDSINFQFSVLRLCLLRRNSIHYFFPFSFIFSFFLLTISTVCIISLFFFYFSICVLAKLSFFVNHGIYVPNNFFSFFTGNRCLIVAKIIFIVRLNYLFNLVPLNLSFMKSIVKLQDYSCNFLKFHSLRNICRLFRNLYKNLYKTKRP